MVLCIEKDMRSPTNSHIFGIPKLLITVTFGCTAYKKNTVIDNLITNCSVDIFLICYIKLKRHNTIHKLVCKLHKIVTEIPDKQLLLDALVINKCNQLIRLVVYSSLISIIQKMHL